MWWSGPEAGAWSPASSADRDCASGLVRSLVVSVVVKLTFSLRRHSVDLTRLEHRVNDVQGAAVEASVATLGHTWGTRLRLTLPSAPRFPNQTKIESLQNAVGPQSGQGAPSERVSIGWDDV